MERTRLVSVGTVALADRPRVETRLYRVPIFNGAPAMMRFNFYPPKPYHCERELRTNAMYRFVKVQTIMQMDLTPAYKFGRLAHLQK